MIVPKLIFADSALWMWIPQLNLRHSLWNNNHVWKDEFFRTDPAIDYNN